MSASTVGPISTEELAAIRDLCRRRRVVRLDIFGSAIRDDFDPERSDIDFQVGFEDMPARERFTAQLALQAELEVLLRRHVDLIQAGSIRNPHVRKHVEDHHLTIFPAP